MGRQNSNLRKIGSRPGPLADWNVGASVGTFTASPPAGWQAGVQIDSTQVYPWNTPQPAAGYSITITLTNAAGIKVYTTSKTVRVPPSQLSDTTGLPLFRDMAISSNAAGADKCSAVVN